MNFDNSGGVSRYYEFIYRRIGLSGALRYLAHPAYQAHALFLTKSV